MFIAGNTFSFKNAPNFLKSSASNTDNNNTGNPKSANLGIFLTKLPIILKSPPPNKNEKIESIGRA